MNNIQFTLQEMFFLMVVFCFIQFKLIGLFNIKYDRYIDKI